MSLIIRIFLLMLSFSLLTVAKGETIHINDGWFFHFPEQQKETPVTLPHTWNNMDGQDGGDNYRRGEGLYRKFLSFEKQDLDKRFFIRFSASNLKTKVRMNGHLVGTHIGGYAAFVFDITPFIKWDKLNELEVCVDNSPSIPAPPLSADFTFFGGIIRDVDLLIKSNVHISPLDYASSGISVIQESVSSEKAQFSVCAKVCNTSLQTKDVIVKYIVRNRKGDIVKKTQQKASLVADKHDTFQHRFEMRNPRLWNGKNDPYLYRVDVSLFCDGKETDCVSVPLGLRTVDVDKEKGFMLNGKPYPLHGVALHEERMNKGRAIIDLERKEDIDRLVDMGCNYLRLSHYQHGDFTYRYLDSLGVVCWTEIPLINHILDNQEFRNNAKQQLKELIRQNINHPCVCAWGVSNEINYQKGPNPNSLIKELVDLVKQEDPSRFSTLAAMFSEKETNFIPQVYSNNRYDGWYYNQVQNIGPFVDDLRSKYPDRIIGISEYGVGAHPSHHQDGHKKPAEGGQWHPEEYQNYFHEEYWRVIKARPFIWSTSVWVAYDFASDRRNEGSQPGINDKGLITFDRRIKKDAYYFYQANWSDIPVLYITSRRFIERHQPQTRVKVYSNQGLPVLRINGVEYRMKEMGECVYLSDELSLTPGANLVTVSCLKDGRTLQDEVTWILSNEKQYTINNL